MMNIYSFVSSQGHILLAMFLLGIALGAFYDLIRVIRRLLDTGRLFVNVSDVVYWVVATAYIWHVQNEMADGVIRFCQLFTVALGMILYYIILSSLVIWIIYTPLHFMGKLFSTMYRYIGRRLDAVLSFIGQRIQRNKKKDGL